MTRNIFLLSVLFCANVAFAQNYEQVHLKDGSIYEGYISKQAPGSTITVQSVRTTIVIPDSEIVSITYSNPDSYKFSGELKAEDDFNVATIVRKNGAVYQSVLVRESGINYRVTSLEQKSQILSWDSIYKITKTPYAKGETKGILDVLLISSTGERLVGQILEQNLPKGLVVFQDTTGIISTFRNKSIQTMRFEAKDHSASLWDQTPLCDRVLLKDGRSLDGFINAKQLGKSVSVLSKESNSVETVPLSNVSTYEKYINPSYVSQVVETEEKNEENLAEVIVQDIPCNFMTAVSADSFYTIPVITDSIKTRVHVNEQVCINFKASTRTSNIRFALSGLTKEKNFSITGLKIKKKGTDLWPKFSLGDTVTVDADIHSNNLERIELDAIFTKPGLYIMYIEGMMDKCVPIIVE